MRSCPAPCISRTSFWRFLLQGSSSSEVDLRLGLLWWQDASRVSGRGWRGCCNYGGTLPTFSPFSSFPSSVAISVSFPFSPVVLLGIVSHLTATFVVRCYIARSTSSFSSIPTYAPLLLLFPIFLIFFIRGKERKFGLLFLEEHLNTRVEAAAVVDKWQALIGGIWLWGRGVTFRGWRGA